MFGPCNVSYMREEFLKGRINKDTKVCDERENKEILKNKRDVNASPLTCFVELVYDPKEPIFVFSIIELDLKDYVFNKKTRRY